MFAAEWDRAKCIVTILALMAFGTVQACNRDPKSDAQVQADLKASSDKRQHYRQRLLDEASVVCRDGTEYLIGDTSDTWSYGGPLAVPHYRNGVLVLCGNASNSIDLTSKEK